MKTDIKRLAMLAALASAWIAPAALAQSNVGPNSVAPVYVEGGVPSIRVSYADLAVQTPEGLSTLTRRIDLAARQVCAPDYRSRRLREYATVRPCMRDAKTDAWDQFAANQARANGRTMDIALATGRRRSAH